MARDVNQSRRWRRPFLAVLLTVLVAVTGGLGMGAAGAAPSAGSATSTTTVPTTLPPVEVDPGVFPTDRPLRIAVRNIPPFDIQKGTRWSGYSIELWRSMAEVLKLNYDFVPVETVGDQLAAVVDGRADLAIGAISITAEREAAVDFTQPIFDSGLQIAVPSTPSSPSITALFSKAVLRALLTVLLFIVVLIVVMGHIMWLVERRKNDDFPHSYVKGVEAGVWWAIVTLTTVGYGDTTAKTRTGRIVAICWMVLGIVVVAQVTATVTSAATVERLQSNVTAVGDLSGKKVVTVRGTVSEKFVKDEGLPAKLVDSIETAEGLLLDGRADAVVYDSPVLRYFAETQADGRVDVVGPLYDPQGYGIALPHNSAQKEALDRALLQLDADGTTEELEARWFGNQD
jgi:polar amino acid transport system substrate-binding protein